MESLYKRKMFASMRKTKVAASKKRQIGLPASILDDSDEGSFSSSSSSSSSGSQSDFQSSPEDDSDQDYRDRSESGVTSSDDSRSVSRRKRSFLGGDDSSSSSSPEEGDPKRMAQPRKRSRLQRQDESDSDQAEEKRREEVEKAKRRQRHNKLLALSRRMKARIPSRRRSRLKQVHSDPVGNVLVFVMSGRMNTTPVTRRHCVATSASQEMCWFRGREVVNPKVGGSILGPSVLGP